MSERQSWTLGQRWEITEWRNGCVYKTLKLDIGWYSREEFGTHGDYMIGSISTAQMKACNHDWIKTSATRPTELPEGLREDNWLEDSAKKMAAIFFEIEEGTK